MQVVISFFFGTRLVLDEPGGGTANKLCPLGLLFGTGGEVLTPEGEKIEAFALIRPLINSYQSLAHIDISKRNRNTANMHLVLDMN